MAHRGGFARGQRQRKHWHSLGGAAVAFTGASTILIDSATFPAGDPYTLLRILGGSLLISFADQTLVANDAASMTVGIGYVSDDAAAVGSSAMPDPASEPDYDWVWWYTTVIRNMGVTTESVIPAGGGFDRVMIASKAMRKVTPKQTLVVVGQYADISGTPSVTVDFGGCRFLIGT